MSEPNRITSLQMHTTPVLKHINELDSNEMTGWKNILDYTCIALLALYLLVLPAGRIGLILTIAILVIKLLITNNITRGLYFIYFGATTLGMLSDLFGYSGIGGKVSIVVALLFLYNSANLVEIIYRLKAPLVALTWASLILLLFYFYGPMSSYCSGKLIYTVINGLLFLIMFYIMFNDPSVNWLQLGQLGILSSYVFLASGLIIMPEMKPGHIFDIGVIRLTWVELKGGVDALALRNDLSFLASFGLIIMVSAYVDKHMTKSELIKIMFYSFISLNMLFWSGARLPIISIIAAVAVIPLSRPKYMARYTLMSFSILGITALYIVYSSFLDINFIATLFDSAEPLLTRLNRSTNWIAGYERFLEKPLLGHGLGGFFIDGFSWPGWGLYPHNLFLELLSEMGIIGTFIFIAPLLLLKGWFGKETASIRAQSGSVILPLFIMHFLQAMISFDLRRSIAVFALIGSIYAVNKMKQNS